MKFPNALKGVGKIYTAEILALIAALFIVLALILGVFGISVTSAGAEDAGVGLALGAGLFTIAFTVLIVISYIINIVGVSAASKDEPAFKRALTAIIVGLVASVIAAVFSKSEIVAAIANAVNRACELLVTYYCIDGIKNLADKIGNAAVKAKAVKAVKLIFTSYIISIVCKVIYDLFQTKASAIISGVIGIVSIVFSIIAYCVYLSLLRNAKKMLAE